MSIITQHHSAATHIARNELCILSMSAVVVPSVEYPNGVFLLGQVAEKLAETRFIIFLQLRSRRHTGIIRVEGLIVRKTA
jgi:hypothetical protein